VPGGQRQYRLGLPPRLIVVAGAGEQPTQNGTGLQLTRNVTGRLQGGECGAGGRQFLRPRAVLRSQPGHTQQRPRPLNGGDVSGTRIRQQPAQPLPAGDVPPPKAPPPDEPGRQAQGGHRFVDSGMRECGADVPAHVVQPVHRRGQVRPDQVRGRLGDQPGHDPRMVTPGHGELTRAGSLLDSELPDGVEQPEPERPHPPNAE